MKRAFLLVALLMAPSLAMADPDPAPACIPPPGGKCLTKEQVDLITQAVQELDDIHKAPALVEIKQPIIVIQDWQGRTYINGGTNKPINVKVTIGSHVDRDLAMTLPIVVNYRDKPPDPIFRLRIRAEFGILVPQAIQTLLGTKQNMLDGGLALDFLHYKIFNVAVYAGVFSSGIGVGLDITRNFGIASKLVVRYEGLLNATDYLSNMTGIYFSFN